MNDVVATMVVNFGESAINASGNLIVEWDDTLNVDADGNVQNSIDPGGSRHMLAHRGAGVLIKDVRSTMGDIYGGGNVFLSRSTLVGFGDANDVKQLNYTPNSVKKTWKGRVGNGLKIDGRDVRVANNFPCLVLLEFKVLFARYKLQVPGIKLAEKEKFPLQVYIYYTEPAA